MVARNYSQMPNKSESISWEKLLKVWLFLLDRGNNDTPITNTNIAAVLGMKGGTVKNARAAQGIADGHPDENEDEQRRK